VPRLFRRGRVPERVTRSGSCRVLRHRQFPACDIDIMPGEPADAADVRPLPLELYMDDDHIRPAMNASSHSPSIPLTKLPSNSTFMDDSTFVRSTFLTKPASARPTTPAALGNTAVDKPAQAQADDVGASSSSSSLGHFDCVLCHMIWASSISATDLC